MKQSNASVRRKLMDRLSAEANWGLILGVLVTSYELDPTFAETDFFPALHGLGAWDDHSWSSRVALEKALAGVGATTILVDQRPYRSRPRSLHVEVMPAVGKGGLFHAKILLIVHERAVRLHVSSANLTEAGYRENREVALPFVATKERPDVAALILDAIEKMPVRLNPWWTDSSKLIHQSALKLLRAWAGDMPSDVGVLWGGDEEPLWKQVVNRWPQGEMIERISIVSPFWSEEGRNGPLATFVGAIRSRGAFADGSPIDLYTEAEPATKGVFRPKLPGFGAFPLSKLRIRLSAHAVEPLPRDDVDSGEVLKTRKLHAKVLLIHGERNTLAYLGSANFSKPGWGFLATPRSANIEAGVVILRSGKGLGAALLPPTTGKPIEIDEALAATTVPVSDPDPVVPTFMRGAWLRPDPKDEEKLALTICVDKARVAGSFQIAFSGGDGAILIESSETGPDEHLVRLDSAALRRLFQDQQVRVTWWASSESSDYPVNVQLESRVELPVVPGGGSLDETLLLQYYQGRISMADLFPPPPGWDGPGESTSPKTEGSQVDTSRIQSYQMREFVEALRGIRDDLTAASQGTPTIMRLALNGQVSPVALARQVRAAVTAGRRGPMAAGFQLVEIANCLREAGRITEAAVSWAVHVKKADDAVQEMLAAVRAAHPAHLGPKSSFARYSREVLGRNGQLK